LAWFLAYVATLLTNVYRLITLDRDILEIKSAAFILSLHTRQSFPNLSPSAAALERFLHYRFLVSHLGPWNLAREWLLYPFLIRPVAQSNGPVHIATISFSMRWLCPTQISPGFVGFLVQREHGLLPKPGGRPVTVKEGRISLRFVSSLSVPPVFSIVMLEDFPIACSNLGPKLLAYKNPALRVVGENGSSVLQLVLDNLLENTWYRGWMSLLDEIDDCVKVQVCEPLLFPSWRRC
jgi:hypothetical protein